VAEREAAVGCTARGVVDEQGQGEDGKSSHCQCHRAGCCLRLFAYIGVPPNTSRELYL
jgi:hypothetical protein